MIGALIKKLSSIIDTEMYTDKLGESGRVAFRRAYEEARSRGHDRLEPEHLLFSIAEEDQSLFNQAMQGLGFDPQLVKQELESDFGKGDHSGSGLKISDSARCLMSNALRHARSRGRMLIESRDLLIAAFDDSNGKRVDAIERLGVSRKEAIRVTEEATKRE